MRLKGRWIMVSVNAEVVSEGRGWMDNGEG